MKRAIAVINREIRAVKFNITQCVPGFHNNLDREMDVLKRLKRKLKPRRGADA